MPKINLLQQAASAEGVGKAKSISSQTGQLLVLAVVVLVLAVGVSFLDWRFATNENEKIKNELADEQKVAQELTKLKEQADELQKKITLVDSRIKVIKQLRAEQRGPVAVLSRINERIPVGVNLDSITQRGNLMTIVGNTNTESLMTGFFKDMEFSGGLFTGLDPQSELVQGNNQEQLYKFTIRCNYNPPVATQNPEAGQTTSN
ncbi:MAG: PilN domain-containing protein [Acidobacteriota bacterium]